MLRMFNETELKAHTETVMTEQIYYVTNIAFLNVIESTELNIIAREASTEALKDKENVDHIGVSLLKSTRITNTLTR